MLYKLNFSEKSWIEAAVNISNILEFVETRIIYGRIYCRRRGPPQGKLLVTEEKIPGTLILWGAIGDYILIVSAINYKTPSLVSFLFGGFL